MSLLIAYNSDETKKNIFLPVNKGGGSFPLFQPRSTQTTTSQYNVSKRIFKKEYGYGILVFRLIYCDELDNNCFDENIYIGINRKDIKDDMFYEASPRQINFAIEYLTYLGLKDYLSNL